jgi:hypothetical protein
MHLLNMADMTPKHGFTCCLSGRLMRSFATDWSRMGFSCVEAPLGGMALVVGGDVEAEEERGKGVFEFV